MTAPALDRLIFKTSRLAEFCSQKELVNQTGHAIADWPLVIAKELIDNALDSAEEAGIAPTIEIIVTQDGITVSDNGSGIAPETITHILDYNARVSSREAYVSPTRGAQGNALKTILAMPYALSGERGETIIESRGVAHHIDFTTDRVRQTPLIDMTREPSPVQIGTRVTVRWPNSAWLHSTRRRAETCTARWKIHVGQPAFDVEHQVGSAGHRGDRTQHPGD
jgi:DNA topoisomerase VI subunit B